MGSLQTWGGVQVYQALHTQLLQPDEASLEGVLGSDKGGGGLDLEVEQRVGGVGLVSVWGGEGLAVYHVPVPGAAGE